MTGRPHQPRIAAACLLAALLPAAPAAAHPDISMECRVLFNMEAGKLTGVGEAWTFDEAFSAQLVSDYDENRNGRFDEDEVHAMETEVFAPLEAIHYYTFIELGGAARDALQPFGFRATLEGNGAVTFAFGFRFPEPVDPAGTSVAVELKDPEFAVFAMLAEDQPALLRGDREGRCAASVADDAAGAYFDGTIIPKAIRLVCR